MSIVRIALVGFLTLAVGVAPTEFGLSRSVGSPTVPGVTVRFSVAGANSSTGSARTDGGGQAAFCYTGTQAGDDTSAAFADTNANGARDGAEPSNSATRTWTVP